MVKGIVSSKSAAGLRRSAIAERLRLREEWSSLKGTDDEIEPAAKVKKKQTRTFSKNLHNIRERNTQHSNIANLDLRSRNKENARPHSSDVLRGVVALVDVGAESRALALRAALTALGATVVPSWSPLVTHLVWSQDGCRDTRARARALACRVVSPLWVEACAASARRISEKVFPSTARDSDLPSPATLCRLLKTAEKENWQIRGLQSDSEEEGRQVRLRISSDQEDDSRRKKDGQPTKESLDVAVRVNTAPRRALPASISPPANPRSRRKLFTVRPDGEDDEDADTAPAPISKTRTQPEKATKRPDKALNRPERVKATVEPPERQKRVKKYNLTQQQKRNLENAGRIAKRLAAEPERVRTQENTQRRAPHVPRIVLSGMPKSQYEAVFTAIQTLKGLVQRTVDHRTTHVLLGTCKEDTPNQNTAARPQEKPKETPQQSKSTNKNQVKPFSICNRCNSPEGLVMKMFECDNVEVTDHCSNPTNVSDKDVTIICSTVNRNVNSVNNGDDNVIGEVNNADISDMCDGIINDKRLRTLKTLLGAARGCRVLHAQWALDSLKENKWLPHIGYEVTYLLKIAQKARIERSAIEKMRSEYAYNVFRGLRVCLTETADKRDAALQLLSLCGAHLVNESDVQRNCNNNGFPGDKTTQHGGVTQNGGWTQNGGLTQFGANSDCVTIVVGTGSEDVSSKWVFDSVAAGRPRTTRRYINKNIVSVQN